VISDLIEDGLRCARWEEVSGGAYYGEVPALPGAWVMVQNVGEQRAKLSRVLSEWIFFRLSRSQSLPLGKSLAMDAGKKTTPPPRQAVTRNTLLRAFRDDAFEGPFLEGNSLFVMRGEVSLRIPEKEMEEVPGWLLARLLRQAGVASSTSE
jgi:hypothetical protein